MSDFDVTDNYKVGTEDNPNFDVTLKSGTTITAELEALPSGRVRYSFLARDVDGNIFRSEEDESDSSGHAYSYLKARAREIINVEEPLKHPVNWSNMELLSLLMEQCRIVLCPVCFGENSSQCVACDGTSWIETTDMDKWIDFASDNE